jgi:hypothetical protein
MPGHMSPKESSNISRVTTWKVHHIRPTPQTTPRDRIPDCIRASRRGGSNSGWHSTRDVDGHISRVVAEAPGMHWRWWRICRMEITQFLDCLSEIPLHLTAFPGVQRHYSIWSHFLNAIADSAFKCPFLEAEIEPIQSTIKEISQSMGRSFHETAFLEIGEVRQIWFGSP